jgi:hypothetical protein
MTWAGLDVHARSTHAAAIDTMTGELVRRRFGPGVDEPVAWLLGLPGPPLNALEKLANSENPPGAPECWRSGVFQGF